MPKAPKAKKTLNKKNIKKTNFFSPELLNLANAGNMFLAQGVLNKAIESYQKALLLKPDFAEIHNNLGVALQQQHKFNLAVDCHQRALAIKPDYPEAYQNLAMAFKTLGKFDLAIENYQKAIALKPDYAEAVEDLFYTRLRCCDWSQYTADIEKICQLANENRRGISPFEFFSVSSSVAEQLKCTRTFVANNIFQPKVPVWTGSRYQHDKIRVAYLSADFHNHATAYLMAGLFEIHDKKRFEIIAISFGVDVKDEMRGRLRKSFQHFIDVSDKTDVQVALLMKELEIDIAVDLKGYTKGCRPGILAYRAAPIQINYLGYPGTMGADYIDYIIADRHIIPLEQQAYYTEKVVYLPDSYQVNDSKRHIVESVPTRAEVNLPETGFVFCCFNNNYKITPEIFDIWMRLLDKVDGSVLWLFESNPLVTKNLQEQAVVRGIASERLIFAPPVDLEIHLARQKLADLFLDTIPINAHTTASDALWCGLPVLTCMGQSFAGRVAGSLLNAIGVPELITDSLEDYEAQAFKLAITPTKLAEIRVKLEKNRSSYPLFDTNRFCRQIEKAYITMWERYQRGESPASFAIPPTKL